MDDVESVADDSMWSQECLGLPASKFEFQWTSQHTAGLFRAPIKRPDGKGWRLLSTHYHDNSIIAVWARRREEK